MRISIILIIFMVSVAARADVRDLGSLVREIRYSIVDHGRALSIADRKRVRFELATTIVSLEKLTGRRARAGYTLEGLAITAQRLFEGARNRDIGSSIQKAYERRLGRCVFILERGRRQ